MKRFVLALVLAALVPWQAPSSAPAMAEGPAVIHLSRTSAAVGDSVTVTGRGFTPGDSVVVSTDFTVGGSTRRSQTAAKANGSGTFSARFLVPTDVTLGTYRVTARDLHGSQASRDLSILRLVVLRAGGPALPSVPLLAGHSFYARGTAFQVGETVTVSATFALSNGNLVSKTQPFVARAPQGSGEVQLGVPPHAIQQTIVVNAAGTRSHRLAHVSVDVRTVSTPAVPLTLFVQPNAIYPGEKITVFGSGFSPAVDVQVSVVVPLYGGGSRTVSATARTNGKGEFVVQLALPANAAAGAVTVMAKGPHRQAGAALQLKPVVPRIAVSPPSVSPGATLTAHGSGYRPGHTIDLATTVALTNGSQATLAIKTTTNGNGEFSVALVMPSNASLGNYLLRAQSEQSGRAAQTHFQVGYHPSIVLRPQTLPPGGSVAIDGQNFGTRSIIRVTLAITRSDGTALSLSRDVSSDGNGRFTTSFSLPSTTRPGAYIVTATDTVSGAQATASLTVATKATVSLNHSSVRPGQPVAVYGAGFTAGTQVQLSAVFPLYGGGARTISFSVTTTGTGTFSSQIVVPSNAAASTVAVTATGPHARATTNLQVQPIAPGITLSPASVRPGAPLTVQGAGYLAGVRVDVTLPLTLTDRSHTTLTRAVTTDQQGRFAVTLIVPSTTAAGNYTVTATSTASGHAPSAHLTISVNPQITVQPSTARPGQTITVQGGGFSGSAPITLTATFGLYGGGGRTVSTTVRTDGNGNFSGRLTIPQQAAAGPVVITARGPNAQRTVQFVVQGIAAHVTLAPAAVLPGSNVQIHGDGYPVGDRVDISVTVSLTNGSRQTLTGTATVDARGTFTTTLQVPTRVVGGTYTLVAKSTSSGRAPTAQLVVTRLAPSVVAQPTTAAPGTQATVNGFGFAAGASVIISLNGTRLGSATANGSGQFSVKVTVPKDLASGTYPLTATSVSGRKASVNLTIRRQVSTHFYFASLYTGNGYHEYLTFLNPTTTQAQVQVTYQPTTGAPRTKAITLNPHSRFTEDVNADVGVHVSTAAAVAADVPIVAERRVFHGSDGSIVPGVTSPSTVWYFANGNTSHSYREYIAIQNPNSGPVQVAVHFLPTHHAAFTIYRTLAAQSRTTVKVNSYVKKDAIGVTVTSNGPVVANRTIFIRHGMTSKMGVTSPQRTWYFAAGPAKGSAHNWIGLINPSNQATYVTLHAYSPLGAEVGTTKGWVKPYGRVGYFINTIAQRTDVAITLTSSQPVVVEQTTYVGRMHDASTDTFGIASPARSWGFAAVNTSGGSDTLNLFNPNLTVLPIAVQFMRANGQVTERTYVVGPLGHQRVDVGSVVPGAQLGIVTTSNQPFVALNRVTFNNGQGSATSSGIAM